MVKHDKSHLEIALNGKEHVTEFIFPGQSIGHVIANLIVLIAHRVI